MEVKVTNKCIVCENQLLTFSIRQKSIAIPGGLFFDIGKIPVKECKKCYEVYEDEITIKDYKLKILKDINDRIKKDKKFQINGHSCFWIRSSILLSREELSDYENESEIKAIEQSNLPLSPYMVSKLESKIQKYIDKSAI
jgi:hypothetical protein